MISAPFASTAPPCYPAWLLAHFAPVDWRSIGPWLAPILVVVLAVACVLNQLIQKKRLTIALLAPLLAVSFLLPPVLFHAARNWDTELVLVRLLTLGAAASLLRFGCLRAQAKTHPRGFIGYGVLALGVVLLLALWLNLRDF